MFAQNQPKRFELALMISTVLHIGLILLISRLRPAIEKGYDFHEVTFMDVTYRPEVAKVLTQKEIGGGGSPVEAGVPATSATGVSAQELAPIDMGATLERPSSQARIELDRYELARGDEMDVVRIGGKGSAQSTEEILAQAPLPLSRGAGGSGAATGLRGVPGIPQTEAQPQLSIERHRISSPSAPSVLPQSGGSPEPVVQVPVSSGTGFQIAGPISERAIRKKVKPRYPKWALDQHICGKVSVRIWVLPNGRVKGTPEVVTSSGYPDLDLAVVEALRLWEFAPLEPGVKAEEQWGVITFVFELA